MTVESCSLASRSVTKTIVGFSLNVLLEYNTADPSKGFSAPILMHGSILPVTIPPGQPRGQVQSFGPGGGELFEADLSRGGGANRMYLLVVLVKYVTSRMTPDRVEKTAYFR